MVVWTFLINSIPMNSTRLPPLFAFSMNNPCKQCFYLLAKCYISWIVASTCKKFTLLYMILMLLCWVDLYLFKLRRGDSDENNELLPICRSCSRTSKPRKWETLLCLLVHSAHLQLQVSLPSGCKIKPRSYNGVGWLHFLPLVAWNSLSFCFGVINFCFAFTMESG